MKQEQWQGTVFGKKESGGTDGKKVIYYNREYRYIKRNPIGAVFFFLMAVFPFEYILIHNYSGYTKTISEFTGRILEKFFHIDAGIGSENFISLGEPIYYVDVQGRNPDFTFCFVMLLVTLAVIVVTVQKFKDNKPFMIYLTMLSVVLIISIVYFVFKADDFPYTLGYYADCYLSQEIVVLGMIAVILGFAISILPNVYGFDLLAFWVTMTYGVIYSTVRYIVYIVFLYWATNLFMAPLYFMMGIFLDFLYVVAIYAIFAKKVSDRYNTGKEQSRWMWS